MNKSIVSTLWASLLLTLTATQASAQVAEAESDVLMPGQTITLDFHELGNMAKELPAECQLRLPDNYNATDRFPILVWFGGGGGSSDVGGARGIVDFKEFIVVALPYPDGRLPRLGVRDGGIEDFEVFHTAMLKRVLERVPNISEDVRIAAGSSSGGHLLGSALDLDWPAFTDYFTSYVLHEGGYAPSMTYRGVREGTEVLIISGGKSKSRPWQQSFQRKFREAYPSATFIEVAEAGHGLNDEGRSAIFEWINQSML